MTLCSYYAWWPFNRVMYHEMSTFCSITYDDNSFLLFTMDIVFVLFMMTIYPYYLWWLFIRIMYNDWSFVLYMVTIYSYCACDYLFVSCIALIDWPIQKLTNSIDANTKWPNHIQMITILSKENNGNYVTGPYWCDVSIF